MNQPTGAPARRPHLSQPDEALRRARQADRMSAADRQAHAAASHVTTSGLTRTGRATLTRLTTALGV